MLRLAEELLLLLLDDRTGDFSNLPDRTLGYALAGVALMDLALEGRIDTDTDSLTLTDPTPVGDDLLDPILADIAEELNARPDALPTVFWIRRIAERAHELRDNALARLADRGILDADDGLTMFALSRLTARARRYPRAEGESEREIHARVMGVLFGSDIPSPEDAMIVGLAHACGAFRQMLTTAEYEEVEGRIELVARLDLIGQSVTGAIRNLSLAESHTLTRVIRDQGGGWPRASGGLPLVGHALRLSGDLRAFFTEQYLRHGPVFEVSAFGRKMVVLAGQEANLFMRREGKSHLRNRELFAGFSHEVGAANVVTGMDGADHRRLRQTMRSGYSRAHYLRKMSDAVAVVERELSQLPLQRPIAGYHTMQRIMTEQISVVSAGTSSDGYLEDAVTFIEMLELVHLAQRRPKFMLRTPRFRRARQRLEELFEKVLASHEPELREGAQRDLVDDLLELRRSSPDFMPDTDLFINVMGPFLVGVDTVSGSVSFMLYALLKHPSLLERVRAEADGLFAGAGPDPEKLRGMTVTQGVILETLRMYPIVPALKRTVTNSFDFAGYRIPAGTQVLMAVAVPHYLPEFFSDPQRFDIDRYSPERRENIRPGAFAPFGLGHHSCLGQGFAQAQMLLTIATMLHRAEIALDPPDYRLKISHAPVPSPDRNFRFRLLRRRRGGGVIERHIHSERQVAASLRPGRPAGRGHVPGRGTARLHLRAACPPAPVADSRPGRHRRPDLQGGHRLHPRLQNAGVLPAQRLLQRPALATARPARPGGTAPEARRDSLHRILPHHPPPQRLAAPAHRRPGGALRLPAVGAAPDLAVRHPGASLVPVVPAAADGLLPSGGAGRTSVPASRLVAYDTPLPGDFAPDG